MPSIPAVMLFDSLRQEKVLFKPLVPNTIRLYVCGITVYDYCHLGHARMLTAFDVMVRFFKACGYHVTYVRNITDIDDKIIQRAKLNNETVPELTERFIAAMNSDCAAINLLPPDQEPRATGHIAEIITLIERLVANKLAYRAENGDVYYAVHDFPGYGKLSHRDLDGLQAGARVEIGESKRDPLDFVLWKAAKPGEPAWASPWGEGRPGWHIECSAMSMHCLGEKFDIHGGGFDLIFPHHENEIAQSDGATGHQCVNYWLHNGFVQVNHEKMSKSLGNFFTLRDILETHQQECVRYFLLSSHYRTQINYSEESLHNAREALTRFYTALHHVPESAEIAGENYADAFYAAMADDFNTPVALAVLFDLVREINRFKENDMNQASQLAKQLKQLASILGILQDDPVRFLQSTTAAAVNPDVIATLIEQRRVARETKQWSDADKIRDKLNELGVILEDRDGETFWRMG